MRRPAPHVSELLTIGMFAPIVVAARMQMLAGELFRPTAVGRREAVRMTAEKPLAFFEGALAAQKHSFEGGLKVWSDFILAANAFLLAAPAMSMTAAMVPVRRRVKANVRRLGR